METGTHSLLAALSCLDYHGFPSSPDSAVFTHPTKIVIGAVILRVAVVLPVINLLCKYPLRKTFFGEGSKYSKARPSERAKPL